MFDMPVTIPDKISTLELSKIWLYKAFQNLKAELEPETELEQEKQNEGSSEDSSSGGQGDRI